MKTLGVFTGISSEMLNEADNLLASQLAAIYMAVKEDKEKLVARLKSLAISYGLKTVVSNLTDNSLINSVMDWNLMFQIFRSAMQVGSTLKKANTYSDEDILAEVDRLNKIEFDLEF